MKKVLLVSIILLTLSSCGPGQALGPTLTPEPTSTMTPVPTSTPTSMPTPIGKSSGYVVYAEGNPDLIDDMFNSEAVDIILHDLKTGNITNLTNNILNNTSYFRPRISPDGSRILFEKQTIENTDYGQYPKSELYIMDIRW